MKEAGTKIRCTVKVFIIGTMVVDTKVTTSKTKNKVSESTHGLMAEYTVVTGTKENNMV
jgi:hypothetical protein